ncbi:hypothetical protein GCM10027414_21560 [Humibacter ginsengiterrae]
MVTDAVRDYLGRIGPIPTLTAHGEVDLAIRIELGLIAADRLADLKVNIAADPESANGRAVATAAEFEYFVSDGRLAYERFVCCNLKLVVSIAKRYIGRGLALMDLIQNGNLGLDRAVKMFDYTRGYKFSTYATWWIRQAIWQSLATDARTIRIPVHTMEKVNRLRALAREFAVEFGREPDDDELAEAAAMAVEEVHRLTATGREPISLDIPIGTDADTEFGDLIVDDTTPSVSELVDAEITREAVRAHVRALPDREGAIVRMRFGLDGRDPMTHGDIGAKLGVSKQRARQLELQALQRLRSPDLQAFR